MLSSPIELDELLSVSNYQFKNEHELEKEVLKLWEIFTQKRDHIQDAYFTEKQIAAYLAFYFSTNFPKIRSCLEKLPPSLIAEFSNYNVLDFGTGPGTFLFGFLDIFPDFSKKLIGLDSSELMISQAKEIKDKFYQNVDIDFEVSHDEQIDNLLMSFSNSLNELEINDFSKLLEKYRPSALVFIEPGTKETFNKIKEVREFLLSKNYNVRYPCMSNSACNLAEDDWCHQYLKLKHSQSIERLTQKLKKDRRNSPVIFHYYTLKKNIEACPIIFRVLDETKFSYECEVCFDNSIVKHRVLKKYLKREGIKKSSFKSFFKAGSLYDYKIIKEISANYFESEPIF